MNGGPAGCRVVVGDARCGEAVAEVLRAGARGYLFDRAGRPDPAGTAAGPGGRARRTARMEGVDGAGQVVSRREIQVLQRVADGQSNAEIGAALGVSALTVKSHLSRVGRRLGTGDRAHLVLLALRAGLIH